LNITSLIVPISGTDDDARPALLKLEGSPPKYRPPDGPGARTTVPPFGKMAVSRSSSSTLSSSRRPSFVTESEWNLPSLKFFCGDKTTPP